MANELHFPREILQHIQSFLTAKESAQTSILSKPWYDAWSTRPVLIFDEKDFPRRDGVVPRQFPQFSMETINRYKRLNLKADKFVIRMKMDRFSLGYDRLANEMITSALEFGVSEIDLKLIIIRSLLYSLPVQVFKSTSLTRLSVDRCEISWLNGKKVRCSRLTSLALRNVKTKNNIVQDILEKCQMIENLDLYNCNGLERVNVSKLRKIVELIIVASTTMEVDFNNGNNVNEFPHLRRMKLEGVKTRDDFFIKFPFMFPSIEDLSLGCFKEINISSRSLKRLALYEGEGLRNVHLNVPNISKIVLNICVSTDANHIKPLPSISFGNVSNNCESDVKLCCFVDVIEGNWFVNLRQFLTELSFSRISLRVTFDGKSNISVQGIPGFPSVPVVDSLAICACSSSNMTRNLLLGFLRSCRPKQATECKSCFDFSILH